jgi:glycosyltransferase involved in cell wall biosynthesis
MGPADAIEVSVVVPSRDRWERLSRTLETVLAQRGVRLEVVVVDDGSTDGTADRLAERGDARVRILRHDASRGVANARNTGMEAARGEWIAWLDDDDLWAPDKLSRQLEAAEAAGADFVYCDAVVVDDAHVPVALEAAPDPATFASRIRMYNSMPGGCSNAMARTSLVRRVGGFDATFGILADWDYWMRALALARPAAVRAPLVGYLVHQGNMVLRDRGDVLEELDRFREKHRRPGERSPVDVVSYCDWVATGLRRGGRRGAAAGLFLRAALRYRSPRSLGLAVRVALGNWAVDLPRSRRRAPPPKPAWLDAYG